MNALQVIVAIRPFLMYMTLLLISRNKAFQQVSLVILMKDYVCICYITIKLFSHSLHITRAVEVLHNLGLRPYFDFVLPSYRAGYEKPEKEIFDQALRIMHPRNPTRPDQALHVGDDLHTDYRGTAG